MRSRRIRKSTIGAVGLVVLAVLWAVYTAAWFFS